MTFDNLNIHPDILKAVLKAGYTAPTEIQAKAIPKIVQGLDIKGSAKTGTGKTAAFLLPALDRIATTKGKEGKGPRVLILVPTRELAQQIEGQAEKYSKYLPKVKSVCVVGGVPYPPQMRKLAGNYDILIATPGRLIDHLNRGVITFPRLEMLVLDEADRMLDMGFVEPIEEIVSHTPSTRQTLFFSATMEGNVGKLSKKLLNNPLDVSVDDVKTKNDSIEQFLYYVDNIQHKNELLDHFLKQKDVIHTIVFTATKRHADELVEQLLDLDYHAAALHGDMNQRQRTRTLEKMKNGKIEVLVATDVAARGIDVHSITHVINFDLPNQAEDYVHRIGRTGRAGSKGVAISFAASRDSQVVREIEKFTGHKVTISEVEGLEPKGKPQRHNDDSGSRSGPKKRSFGSGRGSDRPRGRNSSGAGKKPFKSNSFNRDSGEKRSFGSRSERPSGAGGFGKKPFRSGSDFSSKGEDRPRRSFDSDSRSPSRSPEKGFFDGGERKARSTPRERPAINDSISPERGSYGGDRPARNSFGGDRPARGAPRQRPSGPGSRSSSRSPERGSFGGDRPARGGPRQRTAGPSDGPGSRGSFARPSNGGGARKSTKTFGARPPKGKIGGGGRSSSRPPRGR